MSGNLYPFKFEPILKEKIWGGTYLSDQLNKKSKQGAKIGESWEVSGVAGDVSVVKNGFLAGNTLEELIEVYMGDMVGDAVYEAFGTELPILIKLIDADDDLSIQVHPDDEYAAEHHNTMGKNEMWYIFDKKPGATIIPGFAHDVTTEEVRSSIQSGEFGTLVAKYPVKKGDVFHIPTGRIHAINAGVIIAEIQQTSDITYRIYDYKRTDAEGNERELHIDHALNVLDLKQPEHYAEKYEVELNKPVNLKRTRFFTTNLLHFDQPVQRDYYYLDSFVIIMCIEGELQLEYGSESFEKLTTGETVFLPAELKHITYKPLGKAKILEIYFEGDSVEA